MLSTAGVSIRVNPNVLYVSRITPVAQSRSATSSGRRSRMPRGGFALNGVNVDIEKSLCEVETGLLVLTGFEMRLGMGVSAANQTISLAQKHCFFHRLS